MKNILSILFLISFLAANAYSAEDKEILKCSAIEDSVQRLACFDEIANALQDSVDRKLTEATKSFEKNTAWNTNISKSKIDDSVYVTLSTKTDKPVRGKYREPAYPVLFLRCLENTTSAFIDFDGHFMADIQGYGNVTFRIDKKKAFKKNLRGSTDSKALGLWYGNSSIPFIKSLYGGSTLLIQATPFNESSIMFELDITGLEEAIKPLREACGW